MFLRLISFITILTLVGAPINPLLQRNQAQTLSPQTQTQGLALQAQLLSTAGLIFTLLSTTTAEAASKDAQTSNLHDFLFSLSSPSFENILFWIITIGLSTSILFLPRLLKKKEVKEKAPPAKEPNKIIEPSKVIPPKQPLNPIKAIQVRTPLIKQLKANEMLYGFSIEQDINHTKNQFRLVSQNGSFEVIQIGNTLVYSDEDRVLQGKTLSDWKKAILTKFYLQNGEELYVDFNNSVQKSSSSYYPSFYTGKTINTKGQAVHSRREHALIPFGNLLLLSQPIALHPENNRPIYLAFKSDNENQTIEGHDFELMQVDQFLIDFSDPNEPTIFDAITGKEVPLNVPEKKLVDQKDPSRIYYALKVLGEGGMAKVLLAWSTHKQDIVALKLTLPRSEAEQKKADTVRFKREIFLTKSFDDLDVVQIYSAGNFDLTSAQKNIFSIGTEVNTNRFLYFAMEFLEYGSLQEVMAKLRVKNKFLPLKTTIQIMRKIAETLSHLHNSGVIHRDIKADNILFKKEEVLIADFGIAKNVQEKNPKAQISLQGDILGTPTHMSPEQAQGDVDNIDHRTDIYALGILFYELVTNKTPFRSQFDQSPFEVIMRKIASHDTWIKDIQEIRPDLPEPIIKLLNDLIQKATAADKAERYQNIEKLLEQLDLLEQEIEHLTAKSPDSKTLGPLLFVLLPLLKWLESQKSPIKKSSFPQLQPFGKKGIATSL